jgi:MFS family permease
VATQTSADTEGPPDERAAGRLRQAGQRRATAVIKPFRRPNFRRYATGQVISQSGTWMQLTAVSLVVLRSTDSGTATAMVAVAQFAPILVLGAWAGLVADRLDRHRLLIGISAAGLVAAAALSAYAFSGRTELWPVFALTALTGVTVALENPVRRTFVSDLVPAEELTSAIGMNAAVLTATRIIGPAAAGLVASTAGLEWCFVINALSYVPQMLLLLRLDRSDFQPSPTVARAAGQLRAGVRYAWSQPEVRGLLALMALTSAIWANLPFLLPLLTSRDLGASDVTFTVIYSLMSVGTIIGSVGVAATRRLQRASIARRSAVMAAGFAAMAAAPSVATASMAAVVVGHTYVGAVAGSNALLQLNAPAQMRGRIIALGSVLTIGTAPIAAPAFGAVADAFGARWSIAGGAVLAAAGACVTWVRPKPLHGQPFV